MVLDDIYTELIAEHSRNAEHKHHLQNPTFIERGHNPSCGDEIVLELEVADGKIKNASFTGVGCAISQASTDMMIELLKDKTVDDAKRLADLFLAMIKGEVTNDSELEDLEDSAALQNIANMPARVKCATLAWHTFLNSIDKNDNGS